MLFRSARAKQGVESARLENWAAPLLLVVHPQLFFTPWVVPHPTRLCFPPASQRHRRRRPTLSALQAVALPAIDSFTVHSTRLPATNTCSETVNRLWKRAPMSSSRELTVPLPISVSFDTPRLAGSQRLAILVGAQCAEPRYGSTGRSSYGRSGAGGQEKLMMPKRCPSNAGGHSSGQTG